MMLLLKQNYGAISYKNIRIIWGREDDEYLEKKLVGIPNESRGKKQQKK